MQLIHQQAIDGVHMIKRIRLHTLHDHLLREPRQLRHVLNDRLIVKLLARSRRRSNHLFTLQPLVFRDIRERHALIGVHNQHVADEMLAFLAHKVWDAEFAGDDHIAEDLQVFAIEWQVATDHHV